jgi:hypothetical protein
MPYTSTTLVWELFKVPNTRNCQILGRKKTTQFKDQSSIIVQKLIPIQHSFETYPKD